jgi:hypothetical protein
METTYVTVIEPTLGVGMERHKGSGHFIGQDTKEP